MGHGAWGAGHGVSSCEAGPAWSSPGSPGDFCTRGGEQGSEKKKPPNFRVLILVKKMN